MENSVIKMHNIQNEIDIKKMNNDYKDKQKKKTMDRK